MSVYRTIIQNDRLQSFLVIGQKFKMEIEIWLTKTKLSPRRPPASVTNILARFWGSFSVE